MPFSAVFGPRVQEFWATGGPKPQQGMKLLAARSQKGAARGRNSQKRHQGSNNPKKTFPEATGRPKVSNPRAENSRKQGSNDLKVFSGFVLRKQPSAFLRTSVKYIVNYEVSGGHLSVMEAPPGYGRSAVL